MNKTVLSLLALAALALLTLPTMAAADDIAWKTEYQAALDEAKERDTLVMVKVYTDWCHWCKELDKNVFSDDRVIDLSTEIVNLKSNAEDNGDGTLVAKRYGVRGFPTTLFINGDGEEVDRIGGYLPPEDFLAEMNRIISGKGTLASQQESFESGDMSAEEHVAYAMRYLEKDNLDTGEAILLKSMERYPESEANAEALAFLMMIRAIKSDDEAAESYLAELKSKHPQQADLIARAENTLEQIREQR